MNGDRGFSLQIKQSLIELWV